MKNIRNLIRTILFEEQNDEYKNFMQSYNNRRKAFIDSINSFDDIQPQDIPNIISYIGSEGYDSDEEAAEELLELVETFKAQPEIVTLYRIVAVEDESKIKIDEPGEHYVLYRWLLEDGNFLYFGA